MPTVCAVAWSLVAPLAEVSAAEADPATTQVFQVRIWHPVADYFSQLCWSTAQMSPRGPITDPATSVPPTEVSAYPPSVQGLAIFRDGLAVAPSVVRAVSMIRWRGSAYAGDPRSIYVRLLPSTQAFASQGSWIVETAHSS